MLIRLLLSSLFLLNILPVNGLVIEYDNIFFDINNSADKDEMLDILEDTKSFFDNYLNFRTNDIFSIYETESVEYMQSKFNIPSFIGGFYMNGISYIQPVKILRKKSVLKKTIFIEYGHFILDSYTEGNIPGWFNEGLTSYLYLRYDNHKDLYPCKILNFSDFTDFKMVIKDKNKLASFYYTFYLFIEKLYAMSGGFIPSGGSMSSGGDFVINILFQLKKGYDFKKAFDNITNKDMEEYFNEIF